MPPTTNVPTQGPFGDHAAVKDKDGCISIRAEENIKGKTVGTLSNNTLVYGFFDKEYNPTNWIEADKGCVHQSRLGKIFDSRAIEGKVQGNSATFGDEDAEMTTTKQKFDKTKRKITKEKHDGWTEFIIDDKEIYSTEGKLLPDDHCKSITAAMKGKNVPISKSACDDLYQISYLNRLISYDEEAEAPYIFASNNDANWVYMVRWQIVKGEYRTRIIG